MISSFLYDGNVLEESSEIVIPKQALQIVSAWDRRFTHDRVELNLDENIASRKEYFEIFPAAVAKCMSYTSCITFEVTASSSSSKFREFSCGLLSLSSYAYDFNLGNSIGKLPNTYGIAETENIFQIVSSGKAIKTIPKLKAGAKISMLLDINSDCIDNTGSDGKLHLSINDNHVYTFDNLDCSIEYAFAITLSPYQSAQILPGITVTATASIIPFEEDDDYVPTQYNNDMNAESKNTIESNSFLHHSDEKTPSDAGSSHHRRITAPPPSEEKQQNPPTQPTQQQQQQPYQQLQIPVPSFFPQHKSLLDTTNLQAKKGTSSTESFDCCICLSATKCILFLPCKHLCVCEDCGMSQTPPISHCPICRLRIKNRMKVYM